MSYEFDCLDCKNHIYATTDHNRDTKPTLCAVCQWIRDNIPDHQQDELRQLLQKWEIRGTLKRDE